MVWMYNVNLNTIIAGAKQKFIYSYHLASLIKLWLVEKHALAYSFKNISSDDY